jgi:hypothetical protein
MANNTTIKKNATRSKTSAAKRGSRRPRSVSKFEGSRSAHRPHAFVDSSGDTGTIASAVDRLGERLQYSNRGMEETLREISGCLMRIEARLGQQALAPTVTPTAPVNITSHGTTAAAALAPAKKLMQPASLSATKLPTTTLS